MRDLREFTEQVTSYFSSPGVSTKTPVSTINATHRVGSSGRDDAHSTVPDRDTGAYYKPTSYRGWFYGSTAFPADYFGRSLPNAKNRRYWGRYTWSQWSSGLNTSTLVGCNVSNRPAVPTAVTSSMEASLNSRIADNDWNIAQVLGELPETVDFIVECVLDAISLIRSAARKGPIRGWGRSAKRRPWRKFNPNRSGGIAKARAERAERVRRARRRIDSARSASSVYLGLMYGLGPLLQDVYSSIEYLSKKVEELRHRTLVVKAKRSEPIPRPQTNVGVLDMGSRWDGEWGAKGEIHCKVDSPTLANLASIGLLDPLSLSWELFPLSFVVDWFVPVSAFVSALSGHWGIRFSHGYRTLYAKWSAEAVFGVAAIFSGGSPARITGRLISFDRQEYLTFPVPVPYIRGLSDDLVKSLSQALSLLAITIQRAT